jgi:hypothetical protein
MQTYPLALTAGLTIPFMATADLFVYESGTVTGSTDQRIMVKPDADAEIVLRPGQRFRLDKKEKKATRWQVRAFDPAAVISGAIIIGSGEFEDSNTLNKVTLDATFANNVTVLNDTAHRVPVTLDTTQIIQTSGGVIAYQKSYIATYLAAGAATLIVAPATNVNGIMVNRTSMVGCVTPAGVESAFMANTATPAGLYDGDVLAYCPAIAGMFVEDAQIKIPAGRGLWIVNGGTAGGVMKSILYTIL